MNQRRTSAIGAGLLRAALALALPFAVPARAAAAATDCPLRDRPFSVDTPLVDIMLSPAARAAFERHVPGLLDKLPPGLRATAAPTFGAILSPRALLSFGSQSAGQVGRLDAALRGVPVTAADRVARCARYDDDRVALPPASGRPRLLIFQKINGYRDGPSVAAAEAALRAIAARRGWDVVVGDRGGAMTPATLARVDAVIWNNVSGDVLTLAQRTAFRRYVERGGGFVGIHGSGGDPSYFWDWYADALLGARFKGHPDAPQFQDALVVLDDPAAEIVRGLPPSWTMNDEWYSFATNPRTRGARVLATLDERSYAPSERGESLAMGDHPIAWARCVGDGRAFYSAIGHQPAVYAEPNHLRLLEQAIAWAAGKGETRCIGGREVAAR